MLVLTLLFHFHAIQDHVLIIKMDLRLSINTTKTICHKNVKSHISKVSLDFVKLLIIITHHNNFLCNLILSRKGLLYVLDLW